MKKGDIIEGVITEYDFPNKGSFIYEDRKVVIKGAIQGQKVRCSISKLRKDKAEGRLREVIEKAPNEKAECTCSHFGQCGGCTYQTFTYEEQLNIKERLVKKLIDNVFDDYIWDGIKGSPVTTAYRNKMEYSFGDEYKDGPLALGLHKKGGFYDIITIKDCSIVSNDYNKIINVTLEFYDNLGIPYYKKMSHVGSLRHLVVRQAATSKDILINLVTTTQISDLHLEGFTKTLLDLELEGNIVGILHTKNDSLADVVQSDETNILFGQDYFYDSVLGLKFKISPFSFFQTNTLGAEVLYSVVRDYVGNTKDKVIFDLYSGTGTIAQMLAPVASKVIGVEIVEEAVEAAKENATLNGLNNCEFIAGDVLKVIDDITDKPDIIVLDPPRDGIHPKAIQKIIDYDVDEIVYISCKPTSLARDLEVFKERGYKIVKACAVDQFVNTVHVESVALLTRSKNIKN